MELAEPRVVGQACLLRRRVASVVHGQQVLGQHNAPLQLARTRVFHMREVGNCPVFPIFVPESSRASIVLGERHSIKWTASREVLIGTIAKLNREIEPTLPAREHHLVAACLPDSRLTPPRDFDPILHIVDFNYQVRTILPIRQLHQRLLVLSPVGSIIAMSACRIGNTEYNLGAAFRLNARSYLARAWVANGLHMIRLPVISETAVNLSRPHVERLVDILHKTRVRQVQPQASQVQPMGIRSQIIGRVLQATFLAELCRIEFLVAASEILLHQSLLGLERLFVLERVPAPVAHRAKRNAFCILLGEGLQSRCVDGKREVAVAHSERGQRVHTSDVRIVSRDHLFAVDVLCAKHADPNEDGSEKGCFFHVFFGLLLQLANLQISIGKTKKHM